jgi:hypothetical protein
MADQPGNQTPNTPDVSESELRETRVDDLRAEAKEAGITGTSNMRKDELVEEVAKARRGSTDDGEASDAERGRTMADCGPATRLHPR